MLTVLIVRFAIGRAPDGGWFDWLIILYALGLLWLQWAIATIDAEIERKRKQQRTRGTPWVHMDTP